jgi:hypothetical protein
VSNGSVTDGHRFDLSDAGCTRAVSFVAVSILRNNVHPLCLALPSPPAYVGAFEQQIATPKQRAAFGMSLTFLV